MAAKLQKATQARRAAEAQARAAGKTPAEVKAAGQAARVAVEPRLANSGPQWVSGFGANGGKGSPVLMSRKQTTPTAPTAPAAPPPPPPAAPPPPAPEPEPSVAPGNPALSIPGIDVRLMGENIGIKTKNSSARRSGQISRGTSRLSIPRSSGANSLNIG